MDINEAVLKERELRKQQAIDRFAEIVVNGEAEIASLRNKIAKIQSQNEQVPNFNDLNVCTDLLRKYQ